MGALVALMQNDPNLMACQVARLRDLVTLQEGERRPDAYGFGSYGAGDVLLGKRPSGAPAPLGLGELVGAVEGEALVVHARTATVGNLKDENTHPFRFRRWLFAHDGTVEGWEQVKPRLLPALPDFLRRSIQGETDSEHVFTWFLKLLRDQGHLDSLDLPAAAAVQALGRTVRQLDAWCREVGAQRQSAMNLVATNGRVLVATRRGRPLHYALLEGIVPCPGHGLEASTPENDPRLRPHRAVKAVCFATLLAQPNGFIEVPEGSAVAVSRTLQVTVSALNH
ncbi:MAG TPA: class II glutamine amidotransferase [Anaeromyxobacteraceae bacterium]|nr:class II glutamine amidotransferase [Anaeromyxobacteraceae bacterium]